MNMMTKDVGNSINILVVDEMVAHSAFLKSKYAQDEEKIVTVFSKFNFEDLNSLVKEKEIKVVVIFLYVKRGLYKLLPFLGLDLEIVLCANESDAWWLTDSLPLVNLVDISLPKDELFESVDAIVKSVGM